MRDCSSIVCEIVSWSLEIAGLFHSPHPNTNQTKWTHKQKTMQPNKKWTWKPTIKEKKMHQTEDMILFCLLRKGECFSMRNVSKKKTTRGFIKPGCDWGRVEVGFILECVWEGWSFVVSLNANDWEDVLTIFIFQA